VDRRGDEREHQANAEIVLTTVRQETPESGGRLEKQDAATYQ
jgi:hypothetical protein